MFVLQWAPVIHADTSPLVPPDFAKGFDLSKALVGLVSFATTPGVSSANFKISWPDDQPNIDVEKNSLETYRGLYQPSQSGQGVTGFQVFF